MKHRLSLALLLVVIGLGLVGGAMALAAMMPTIVQHVVSGGGGQSRSAGIEIVDTVGQPVVGTSGASGVRLEAGFWAGGVAPVETPSFPTPTARPTPTRTPTPSDSIQLPLLLRGGSRK